ncbi:MAG: twin-arginine translocation signal domain-containing protein [Smithella sp.]|nr:twin-arginine translocation signal domain-containing protein [Smithella sp.]
MKNDLIKSVYDLEEKSEGIGRRDFIKKAGIAGLALAGLGSLGGCYVRVAHENVTKDFDVNSHKQYDSGPIPITKIEDFLLSGEELYGMRLTWPEDRHYMKLKRQANPMFLNNVKSDGSLLKKEHSWKRLMNAEYTGKTNFPNYFFFVEFTELENEENAKERIKEIKPIIENFKFGDSFIYSYKKGINPTKRIYSRDNFVGSIATTRNFINEAHKNENIARLELYQKKRGLILHWKDG